jgi:hypothetical protein
MTEKKMNPPWIERPDIMTRIVHLEFPLVLGAEDDAEGTVDKLTMKRPKVGDILAAGKLAKTEDERLMQEVARMSGQLPSLIEKLYASDFDCMEDAYYELRYPSQKLAVSAES